ncbi:MAG: S8 family serine peptidase [Candidatus Nanopelagicales bacterium]
MRTLTRFLSLPLALSALLAPVVISPAAASPATAYTVSADGMSFTAVRNAVAQVGGRLIAADAKAHLLEATLSASAAQQLRAAHVSLSPTATYSPASYISGFQNVPLDSIDQLPSDVPGQSFLPPKAQGGDGVTIYIVDTGVRSTHEQFGSRVRPGVNVFNNDGSPGSVDCNGHGTGVASLAAGKDLGTAPNAIIVPVAVYPCAASGVTTSSYVIARAMAWILADHKPGTPAVANFSMETPANGSVDTVLEASAKSLIDAGVVLVGAVGNNNADACGYWPAYDPSFLRIGAIGTQPRLDSNFKIASTEWHRSGFSNYGSCVDMFAPGGDAVPDQSTGLQGVFGAGIDSDNSYAASTGTSDAAPFVAGAAARYLSVYPDATVGEVRNFLHGTALAGVLDTTTLNGSPNITLHLSPTGITDRAADPNAPAAPLGMTATAGPNIGDVTVAWQASGTSGYRISFVPQSGAPAVDPRVAPVDTLSTTFTGLASGATYIVRVQAISGKYVSLPASASVTVGSPTPNAPASVTATSVHGGVSISWAPKTGTPVDGYHVQVLPGGGGNPVQQADVDGSTLSVAMKFTAAPGSYVAVVTAKNGAAVSAGTSSSPWTVAAPVIKVVKGMRVKTAVRSAIVTWVAARGVDYRVRWSITGGKTWKAWAKAIGGQIHMTLPRHAKCAVQVQAVGGRTATRKFMSR